MNSTHANENKVCIIKRFHLNQDSVTDETLLDSIILF